MAKSEIDQEKENIEKIFKNSSDIKPIPQSACAEEPKPAGDREEVKECERSSSKNTKGQIENYYCIAEAVGRISSEVLSAVNTQRIRQRESEAKIRQEDAKTAMIMAQTRKVMAQTRKENACAQQEEVKADILRAYQESYRKYFDENPAIMPNPPTIALLSPPKEGEYK